MFWKYNFISGSTIETLLDKEDVTLKELLDEEDVLQECKAQNKKLLDFLVKPEVMEELVNLITTEPSAESDERTRFRHPNRACELLTFDIPQINEALVGNEALLIKLYSFLDVDGSMNPLQASFFSKTMGLLISKKTQVMFDFLKERQFIQKLLSHIDTSAIMDLLLRLTSLEDNESRQTILCWLHEQNLIQSLVDCINVEHSEEIICNAAYSLCDIIKVSRDFIFIMQENSEQNPLLEVIESEEIVTKLLNNMFKDVTKESAIVHGVSVLLTLVVFKKQTLVSMFGNPGGIQMNMISQSLQAENAPPSFLNTSENETQSFDEERLANSISRVITAIVPFLENFHNLLLKPPVKPAITFTIGCLDPPLGICRLEVARLLAAILGTNNHEVNVKLASLNTIIELLNMFYKYSWNNFLHTQVENTVGRIISNPPTTDKEGNKVHPLLEQLLLQYKLTSKIVESFNFDSEKSGSGINKKGYKGHLTKIANSIVQGVENGVNSAFIKEKLKQLPEEEQKLWEDFVNGTLAEINTKNRVISVPTSTSALEDDSTGFERAFAIGKESTVRLAFTNFPINPQFDEMTNNFVDQFGFADDELTQGSSDNKQSSELFEELCNAKENSPLGYRFGFGSFHDENSSDSDEETQVFEAEDSKTEDLKMDVDNQGGESIPMDVTPAPIPDPWSNLDASKNSSDEQSNWADFSSFGAFESSNETSTKMETLDSSDKKVASEVGAFAEVSPIQEDAPFVAKLDQPNSNKADSFTPFSEEGNTEEIQQPDCKSSDATIVDSNNTVSETENSIQQ